MAAIQSCQPGISPTIQVAERIPTSGTAMIENALAVAGSSRASPNQMICETP